MIRIGIAGALGRMGKTIAQLCRDDSEIQIVSAIENPQHPDLNKDYGLLLFNQNINVLVSKISDEVINNIDVLIDFSTPLSTLQNIEICSIKKKPVVIGTTGFKEEDIEKIQSFKNSIPILISPNMSLGVNILFYLVEEAAKKLKNQFEVEIIEIHHSKKKDAPSGTAVRLKEIIKNHYNLAENNIVYGRNGIIGERSKDEIGVHAIRGGDVVGEHTVFFFSEGERIEITHKATSRIIFAKGAILSAKWIYNKKPGFYTMKDVLNIKA